MAPDEHYETLGELERSFNSDMARLLPGYIERHRQEILDAVIDEAQKRDPHASDLSMGSVYWGVVQALDVLAKGLVGEEL